MICTCFIVFFEDRQALSCSELQGATQGLKCATRAVEKHVLQRFATQLLCDLTGFELQ